MKRWTFLALSIVTSFSSFAFAVSKLVASDNNNPPSQISDYYRNYNFVNLFSSELERELITDSLMCKGVFGKPNNSHLNTSFKFCDQIPKLPESERLKKISTLITELNKDIISDTGDKMVIQGYIPGANFHMRRSNPQVMPFSPNPYSLQPRLFKINQVRLSDNSATVEVTVYPLDPKNNAKLSSQYKKYESGEKENPNNEQLMKLAVPSTILSREYHQWVLNNGQWQRFETSTALIKK
jgi:hypothetical protein